jgi:NDP-sugar pyrophosphorylase family protein
MSCKALVLCGGYGTRLGKLTQALPKPLLPVGDVPLVGHTLALLAHHGVDQVAINTHFMPEAIEDALEDGTRFGVDLHYAHEPKLLGTAGALANLRDYFADAHAILVIYGDLLTDQDLGELLDRHAQRSALATLLLHRRRRSNSTVAMDEEGRLTAFLERPSDEERARAGVGEDAWVNSGVQVISPELLAEIPDGVALDLPRDLYARRVGEGRFFGAPLTGYRCAIDSPHRYRAAVDALASGQVRSFVPCPVGNG